MSSEHLPLRTKAQQRADSGLRGRGGPRDPPRRSGASGESEDSEPVLAKFPAHPQPRTRTPGPTSATDGSEGSSRRVPVCGSEEVSEPLAPGSPLARSEHAAGEGRRGSPGRTAGERLGEPGAHRHGRGWGEPGTHCSGGHRAESPAQQWGGGVLGGGGSSESRGEPGGPDRPRAPAARPRVGSATPELRGTPRPGPAARRPGRRSTAGPAPETPGHKVKLMLPTPISCPNSPFVLLPCSPLVAPCAERAR